MPRAILVPGRSKTRTLRLSLRLGEQYVSPLLLAFSEAVIVKFVLPKTTTVFSKRIERIELIFHFVLSYFSEDFHLVHNERSYRL